MMPENFLVAGGAGFIGSHLCDSLLASGNTVFCVDNLCTGSKKNLESAFENKNFSFIKKDVSYFFEHDLKASRVFHLASPASPKDFTKIPLEIIRANVDGSRNLLEFAKKNNARYLFASTSEVYGNPLEHPQKESYFGNVNPFGVRSCYDESKRLGESLAFVYQKYFGVDVRIARIFNTYGPRMSKDDGRLIPNFINQALQDKPLTVYGNGKQTRSFCFVSDLVEGFLKLMDSDYSFPVNLGNTNELSILQVAERIIDITGSSSKLVFSELPVEDPVKRRPDISLSKNYLGWTPNVSFNEGVKKTVEHFMNYCCIQE
jgi:nucleoside-diphosphate-sugar epimerase